MYEYKTEIIMTGTKWFCNQANEKDIQTLNDLFNNRSSEGWDLVTYSYMGNSIDVKGATLVTFKRKK